MSADRSPHGASAVGDPDDHRRRGFPLWLAALLALLVIGLILFMLLRGGGDDDDQAGTATPTASASEPASGDTEDASETAGSDDAAAPETGDDDVASETDADASASPLATGEAGGAGGAGQDGTLTTDGQALLPLPADGLSAYAEQTAESRGANVESVVSDEGFWVGDSEQDRVFAFLAIDGESAPQIVAGQPVTFTGTLRPLPTDPAAAFGLTPDDGLDQLTQQGHYLEVTEVTETP